LIGLHGPLADTAATGSVTYNVRHVHGLFGWTGGRTGFLICSRDTMVTNPTNDKPKRVYNNFMIFIQVCYAGSSFN